MMNAPVAHRALLQPGKFADPLTTLKGEKRASVALTKLDTLWFNTGTLCNITCTNCYIESSPRNDRLAYLSLADVDAYLAEIKRDNLGTRVIGFTGGEPFMNPAMTAILKATLEAGFEALVLTNAMQPMQRPAVKRELAALIAQFGRRLSLRISLDHYGAALHDLERGQESFGKTVEGIAWLVAQGADIAIAGRTCWDEDEAGLRQGYSALFAAQAWPLDAADPARLVLFPEMDERVDVPEITTACWSLLNVDPHTMMCASSRMVVKRKGEAAPVVLPCTLLPYDERFDMGQTLADAARADGGMFDRGAVRLAHPHCAKFCVLGGGSCQAG